MSIKTAAEGARHLAKQYRSVLELVDALDEVGSVLAAKEQAEKNLVIAQEGLKAERDRLSKVKDDTRKAVVAYNRVVETGRAELTAMKVQAKRAQNKAEEEAKRFVTESRGEAADIIKAAKNEAVAVRSKTKTLDRDAKDLTRNISNLRNEMADLQSKFN